MDLTLVKLSKGSKYVAFLVNNQIVVLDNDSSSSSQLTLEGHKQPIQEMEFSCDGKYLASKDKGGHLIVWSMEHRAKVYHAEGVSSSLQGASFSKNGHNIVLGFNNNQVEVIDLLTGLPVQTIFQSRQPVKHILFSNQDQNLFLMAMIIKLTDV